MSRRSRAACGNDEPTPRYWRCGPDGAGGTRLTYAVRGGGSHAAIIALGGGLVAAGAWGIAWLTAGGGLTVAGWIFLLLVPGGAIVAGLYCLDRMLLARDEYVLASSRFSARTVSLFGGRRTDIARSAIRAVVQHYTPPPAGASSSHPGDWVTFVQWRAPHAGRDADFALAGLHSEAERNWLGPLLAAWAGVPLRRGFSASAAEADPDELPDDA